MTQKSRIGLGRDVVLFLTAVVKLLSEIADLVTKVVSYACCHTQLRLQLSA